MLGLWIGALCCALAGSAKVAPQSVELVIAAKPQPTARLLAVLVELLERVEITLTVNRVDRVDTRQIFAPHAPNPRVIARIWIDASDGAQARLYLLDPPSARLLVRQVPLAHGLDELAREQVAHIIGDAVGALRAGRTVGVPVEEVRALLAPPALAPPALPKPVIAARPLLWDAGLLYELQGFAKDAAPHGFGATATVLSGGPALSLGGTVMVVARGPIEAQNERVQVELRPWAVRLMGIAEVPLQGRLRLVGGLGAVLDIITIRPATQVPGVDLASERSRVALLASGVLGLSWRANRFSVLAAAVADGGPSRARYYVEQGDGRVSLLEGWPVRPGFMLALKYSGDSFAQAN